jgi:hypothetical protein
MSVELQGIRARSPCGYHGGINDEVQLAARKGRDKNLRSQAIRFDACLAEGKHGLVPDGVLGQQVTATCRTVCG